MGDKLALIDFDDFLLDNPIADVASFVAHLLISSLKETLTFEQSCACIRSCCRAYKRNAPWGLPADVLIWQTVAQLVGKQARRSAKTEKRRRRHTVGPLLNLAEDILAGKLELT